MMLLSMKICSLLLWGVCIVFASDSVTSPAPENSNMNTTAPTVITTNRQTAANVSVLQPAILHPARPSNVTAQAEEAALPTAEHKNRVRNTTNSSESGRLGLTTAEASISSSKPLAPAEKVTTENVVPVKTTAAAVRGSTARNTSTGRPQSVSPTITARRDTQPFAEPTTAIGGTKSSSVTITAMSKEQVSSSRTTGDAKTFAEVTSTGSGRQPSTAMATATSEVQPSHPTTAEEVNQTTDRLLHTTDKTAPSTDSTSASSTPITEFRSEVPSPASFDNLTQSAPTFRGPTTSGTVKPTTAQLSTSSRSVPATATFNSTSPLPVSTSTNYSITTTANSTSPAGVFVPYATVATASSAPSTTKPPCEPSKDSAGGEVLPCSSRGMVKQCLVVIAVLAVVATVFIVSTIVLCVKLSARKYKVRKPQQDTEMMCISALLPDRSHGYTRQRNPVSNGVLVYPAGGDSDEEGGDNLTLSSFLPENDRYV